MESWNPANPTDEHFPNNNHETWLDDDLLELDLEAELTRARRSSSVSTSGMNNSESDFDLSSSLYQKVRLPPSGRSSVTGHNSHIEASPCEDKISHDMLVKSFGKQPNSGSMIKPLALNMSRSSSASSLALESPGCAAPQPAPRRRRSNNSSTGSCSDDRKSDESGCYFDYEKDSSLSTSCGGNTTLSTSHSMMSGLSSAATPLSPVHEAREPSSAVTSPTDEIMDWVISEDKTDTRRHRTYNHRDRLAAAKKRLVLPTPETKENHPEANSSYT